MREGDAENNITLEDDKKRNHGEPVDSENQHGMEMDLLFVGDSRNVPFFQRMRLAKLSA